MSDVLFWGLLATAILALVIMIVVIVAVSADRRRDVDDDEFAEPRLIDAFADATDRVVRIRATVHAGSFAVDEPVSGEPVLWFRVEGRGHNVSVESEADLRYPFVIRRRGDIVVRDLTGTEAHLDESAGFVVPLDRFGHVDFDLDDDEFGSVQYELTDDVRERLRPLVGDAAEEITSLDRLALVVGSDVTVTGLVQRGDVGFRIVPSPHQPVVVSTLDDEGDATHPRPMQTQPVAVASDDSTATATTSAAAGGAAAGGAAALLASARGGGGRRGLSQARRVARAGGMRSGGSSGGAGLRQVRRYSRLGRRARSKQGLQQMAKSQTRRVPAVREARKVTRSATQAKRRGARLFSAKGAQSQARRMARKRGGSQMRSASKLTRLLRRGRGGGGMRLPVRPPRVG